MEIDLTRIPHLGHTRLAVALTSLRLGTLKPKMFPVGTEMEWPIVPLLRGPELLNPDALSLRASAERFRRQFSLLPDHLKPVNGTHSAAPAGIERGHHLQGYQMATGGQVVARL